MLHTKHSTKKFKETKWILEVQGKSFDNYFKTVLQKPSLSSFPLKRLISEFLFAIAHCLLFFTNFAVQAYLY